MSQDNRRDMGIPVFWTTSNSDPPWNFKIWLDQFLLTVTVKESVNPELLLEEPREICLSPYHGRRHHDNKKMHKRLQKERPEINWHGTKFFWKMKKGELEDLEVGHNVFYNEVQKRVASILFLALGTEGKKKFVQKNPHVEVSKLEFRKMVALAKISFDKTQCVTYERYKLFNRAQETG